MQRPSLLPVLLLGAWMASAPSLSAQQQEPSNGSKAAQPTQSTQRHPNFVFVQLEGTGAGWASTSVAMDDRMPEAKGKPGMTPNLEALAKDGMRFSDFYVSAPRCTPARATFLTGISAAKLKMTYVNEGGQERRGGGGGGGGRNGGGEGGGNNGGRARRNQVPDDSAEDSSGQTKWIPPRSTPELPAEITTVAEMLKQQGYATAHFGKWHVGRNAPSAHGFDEHDGPNTNQGPGRDPKPNPEQGLAITDKGLAFAKARHEKKQPFFLQLSHYGGGSAEESSEETRQKLAQQIRGLREKSMWQAAILHDVDTQIGRLLAGLEELGIAEDTYVFVSFDHGMSGRNSNAPLSGGKGSVREGGVRVPLLVRGPGVTKGVSSHVRSSGADLLPTIASLAGIAKLPSGVEGGSLAAVLHGKADAKVERPREEFVVHFPHYDLSNGGPASAIWLGDHKLIRCYEDGSVRLYDLSKDRGEAKDLSEAMPERRKELEKRLDEYLTAIDAAMPTKNPDYTGK